MTTPCKRFDGTTCGRNVDKESSQVGWCHVGDATSPAGPDCTLPPVCWTCGEAIDLGDGAERAFHIVRISDVSGAPILGDSADGTKPEPGQERCRQKKATECAQGRESCSGDLYVDPPHHQVPTCTHGFTVDVLHHADGSPCLGPECKAHPSTGGQIIERHEPGIVERAPLPARLRADASDLRGLVPSARAWSDTFKVIARNLDEAAAHIEGLEGERRELYEAANANLGEGDEPVTSHEDLRVMLLVAYPNERYLRAENRRLREALDGMVDAFMRLNDKHGDRYAEEDTCKEFAVARAIQREALKETP